MGQVGNQLSNKEAATLIKKMLEKLQGTKR